MALRRAASQALQDYAVDCNYGAAHVLHGGAQLGRPPSVARMRRSDAPFGVEAPPMRRPRPPRPVANLGL